MRITQKAALIEGTKYWNLYVDNSCHWSINVTSSIYHNYQNWDKMIVFDDEKDATDTANEIQKLLCPYLIQ